MTGSTRPPGGEMPDDPPIAELRDIDMPVSADFLDTLRKKIDRRATANHFLDLFWFVPAMVVLEFVVMVVELVAPDTPKGGSR